MSPEIDITTTWRNGRLHKTAWQRVFLLDVDSPHGELVHAWEFDLQNTIALNGTSHEDLQPPISAGPVPF